MALHSKQTVCNPKRPTQLYPVDADGVELMIFADNDIYLGNSDLSEKTGFILKTGNIVHLSLGPGEMLYGLGEATVFILATKNG